MDTRPPINDIIAPPTTGGGMAQYPLDLPMPVEETKNMTVGGVSGVSDQFDLGGVRDYVSIREFLIIVIGGWWPFGGSS